MQAAQRLVLAVLGRAVVLADSAQRSVTPCYFLYPSYA